MSSNRIGRTKLVWNMVDKTGTVIYSFTRLAGQ